MQMAEMRRPCACLLLVFQLLYSFGAKIGDVPELAVDQVREEAFLEVKFDEYKQRYGVGDQRTLEVFFQLFDLWIMLYRLNKADAALEEIVPACEWRHDDYHIKAIQALAFTRWKQSRFREALAKFHEMESWLGKSAPLCENIGHTYNALGRHELAEQYFQQALTLSPDRPSGTSNEGGILLGLAGIRERSGKLPEALEAAQQSYDFYKARDTERGWESSLTAKAAMQLSKVLMQLGRLEEAERKAREAVRLFDVTSGDHSPLLAGAYKRVGELQMAQGRRQEASAALHSAYKLEAIKDAFDLTEIVIIHQMLMDSHLGKGDLIPGRSVFVQYYGTVNQVLERVRKLKQDGNAGVYYKYAGEVFVLGKDCKVGTQLLSDAIPLLAAETSVDTTDMVRQCQGLISYCASAMPKAKPEL